MSRKWNNIKEKKTAKDTNTSKIYTKFGREILMAARRGEPDPQANQGLRTVLERAKTYNIPRHIIDRAIEKAKGAADADNFEEITYEGYGPNGVAVIVNTLTDNRNRTAANVRSAFTKGGGNMGQTGSVDYLFQRIGHIAIEKNDNIDEDTLMGFALEAGATDFIPQEEGYEIITEPNDFSEVMDAIKDKYTVLSAEVISQPMTTVALIDPNHVKSFNKMIDLLEEDDDVQDVFHNGELE